MLKGSTMDDSALREFIHVLSLDYKGAKAERILQVLSDATAAVGAVPRNGAQDITGDDNTGPTGPVTHNRPDTEASARAKLPPRPRPPVGCGNSMAVIDATQTPKRIDRAAGGDEQAAGVVGTAVGDGETRIYSRAVSSTELDISPMGVREGFL